MLILECPHCNSCFSVEDWNKSPHMGDDIPENLEDSTAFDDWNIKEGSSQFDCPECDDVAITEDMTVV